MSISPRNTITAIIIWSLATASAQAGTLETFQKAWNDPALVKQIDDNIERYRKGDAVLEIVDAHGVPVCGAKVKIEQKTHEFLFGCNAFVLGQLDTQELNRKYEAAFLKLFNSATVPFYWGDLEPEQGKPRFEEGSSRIWRRPPPDRLVKWCKANGIMPKGHALMYAKNMFMPKWLDNKDPKALQKFGRKHMAEIAERYGSQIPIWDAVNEEMSRRASPEQWCAVPDNYQAWCFKEAGRVIPKDVKLLVNEGTVQTHRDTAVYETMVKDLLDQGVRVEGIGIQFHTHRGAMFNDKSYKPNHLLSVYERLGRLGLPLYITEITVPATGKNGAAVQNAITANLYRLWFGTPSMAGVTWWNLGDGMAFRKENERLGGLTDKDLNPKPAYNSLDRLINHEWKTRLKTKSDDQGKVRFRGRVSDPLLRQLIEGTPPNP